MTPSPTPSTSLTKQDREFAAVLERVFTPPERLHVDEMAERHRVLDRRSSAEPGPWRNERMPHLIEVMRCLTDKESRHVVFMASSQVGKTEVGLNWVLRTVKCAPAPVLWVTSTEDSLKKVSRRRLGPMLDSPAVKELVAARKSRDSDRTTTSIAFENGCINLSSSNSPSALASDPIRDVIFDEVDRYKASSQDEGDAVALGLARQTTFEQYGAKTLYISSPDIAGESRIEKLFEQSDKRFRHVPCWQCGELLKLDFFRHVKWDDDNPATARIECDGCGAHWNDEQRWRACLDGVWIAEAPFRGTAGFFISSLYSSFVRLQNVVEKWLKAQGNNEELQGFYNTVLGIPWSVDQRKVSPSEITLEHWEADFPINGCLLVSFTDVQGDRLECSTYAVAPDETLFGVHHEIIFGTTTQPEIWKALEQHLVRRWTREDGRVFNLAAAGIDCSYEMDRVCLWAAETRCCARVFAIKGESKGLKERVVFDRRASRSKGNLRFYRANVDKSKDEVLTKLTTESGVGRLRYPERDCFNAEFFKQLTAEKRTTRYVNGYPRIFWKKQPGARNETLDCAAGAISVLRWLHPNLDAVAATVPPQPKPDPAQVAQGKAQPTQAQPAIPAPRFIVKGGMPLD